MTTPNDMPASIDIPTARRARQTALFDELATATLEMIETVRAEGYMVENDGKKIPHPLIQFIPIIARTSQDIRNKAFRRSRLESR